MKGSTDILSDKKVLQLITVIAFFCNSLKHARTGFSQICRRIRSQACVAYTLIRYVSAPLEKCGVYTLIKYVPPLLEKCADYTLTYACLHNISI